MRDRFSDWNLYHKTIIAILAAMIFGVILRGILVYDTAFEIADQRIIPAPSTTVWAWLSADENRDKWQAELMDMVELTGPTAQPAATRLMFWKRGLKRWQSVERTRDVLVGRVLGLYQTSDSDTRWVTMTLEVVSPCETRLKIEEIIEPTAYADRFWFFNQRAIHEKRLTASFDALDRWTALEQTGCPRSKVP